MEACLDYLELMNAVLDGEATPEEEKNLRDHLALCPPCAALFADLSALVEGAGALTAAAPEGFAKGVMERVHTTPQVKAKARRPRWQATAALAAVCALAIFGSGALQAFRTGGSAAPNADMVGLSVARFTAPVEGQDLLTDAVVGAETELSPAQALERAADLLYGAENLLALAYEETDGGTPVCVVTTQERVETLTYTGTCAEGWHTLERTWEGQTSEEADLARCALSPDGQELVLREGFSTESDFLSALKK